MYIANLHRGNFSINIPAKKRNPLKTKECVCLFALSPCQPTSRTTTVNNKKPQTKNFHPECYQKKVREGCLCLLSANNRSILPRRPSFLDSCQEKKKTFKMRGGSILSRRIFASLVPNINKKKKKLEGEEKDPHNHHHERQRAKRRTLLKSLILSLEV